MSDKTPEQLAAEQAAAEAAAAAAAAEKAKKEKTVEVRVLTACAYGNHDDVVELTAAQLKAAKADGLVDDHKDAVAYAKAQAKAKAAQE